MFPVNPKSYLPPPEPAIVRTISREDVQWRRHIFKAPPLKVQPPVPSLSELAAARLALARPE